MVAMLLLLLLLLLPGPARWWLSCARRTRERRHG
eukprot:COSAG01_NODE_63430_length_280_cov_0.574586_1_plen_33_part_01